MQLRIYGNVILIHKGSVCAFEFLFTICHHDPEVIQRLICKTF